MTKEFNQSYGQCDRCGKDKDLIACDGVEFCQQCIALMHAVAVQCFGVGGIVEKSKETVE